MIILDMFSFWDIIIELSINDSDEKYKKLQPIINSINGKILFINNKINQLTNWINSFTGNPNSPQLAQKECKLEFFLALKAYYNC